MTIKVTLLLSTTLFECWLPNIYFGYHCARAQQFFDSAKDSRLFCKALYARSAIEMFSSLGETLRSSLAD